MWKADVSTRVDENVTVPNSREDYPGAQHIAYDLNLDVMAMLAAPTT